MSKNAAAHVAPDAATHKRARAGTRPAGASDDAVRCRRLSRAQVTSTIAPITQRQKVTVPALAESTAIRTTLSDPDQSSTAPNSAAMASRRRTGEAGSMRASPFSCALLHAVDYDMSMSLLSMACAARGSAAAHLRITRESSALCQRAARELVLRYAACR